jgi:colanic acid/amylovoran biosynthesis protein
MTLVQDLTPLSRTARRDANCAAAPGICLVGGGFDSGNLGVAALTESVLWALAERLPTNRIALLDHSAGVRAQCLRRNGHQLNYDAYGARWSRRLYRRDSMLNIRMSARFGGLGNPASTRFLRSSTILDISGGDSFTDLYGMWRYRYVVAPKLMAIEAGIPLVLLPQTFGPFLSDAARNVAQRIVRGAREVWARDTASFGVLRELLGAKFDPARHHCGLDVAIGLPPTAPSDLPTEIRAILEKRHCPLVGFNISGLIFHDPKRADSKFGIKADYAKLVIEFLSKMLQHSEARVLLVPHVLSPSGHFESDHDACQKVATALAPISGGRVHVLPPHHDAAQTKWIIGQMDWFCGTRMHSTIAALSTGVPTAAIAYSDKCRGVFESFGQGAGVADPRSVLLPDAIERLWRSWSDRAECRTALGHSLPHIERTWRCQMDSIARACCG